MVRGQLTCRRHLTQRGTGWRIGETPGEAKLAGWGPAQAKGVQGEPAGCLLLQGSSGLCFSEVSSPAQSSALEETAALLWAQACPGPTCTCCSHPRTQAAACPDAPQAAGFLESVGTGMGTRAQGPGCGFGVRELAQGWGPPTTIPMAAVSPITHHCIPRCGALSRHLLAPANRVIGLGSHSGQGGPCPPLSGAESTAGRRQQSGKCIP